MLFYLLYAIRAGNNLLKVDFNQLKSTKDLRTSKSNEGVVITKFAYGEENIPPLFISHLF